MNPHRRWLTAALMSSAAVAATPRASRDPTALPIEGRMPSLRGATRWLNSEPLDAPKLRGKVVLIDFWTYTCINWWRTLPYLRAWAHKYGQHGLVVIGVHTPEFTFEKELENVRRNARQQNVDYPVAVDSDSAIWRAFDNHYRPALYFVDTAGRIRHHVFGEGEYARSEAVIQQLLRESGASGFDPSLVAVEARGAEAAADWQNLKSPETYLGSARSDRFRAAAPPRLALNEWGLQGRWDVRRESALSRAPGARLAYRFRARDLHLVMGPAAGADPVRFRVLIDGALPIESHGSDLDTDGLGTLDGPRMYQLIRQPYPIAERLFEIEFASPGAAVFAFTFG